MQVVGAHHVGLGEEDRAERREVEEREEADDEPEDTVGRRGRAHRTLDEADPVVLERLPGERRTDRTDGHVAEPEVEGDRPAHAEGEGEGRAEEGRDGHGDPGGQGVGADRPGAHDGERGREDDEGEDRQQEQEAAATGLERVGPGVAGHTPDGVHRVLEGLPDTETAVEGDDPADEKPGPAATKGLRLAELLTDDRDLRHRRVDDALLEVRVVREDDAEGRREDEQQGEEREERVVGDEADEVAGLVVEELVDDREGVAHHAVLALEPVQAVDDTHARIPPHHPVRPSHLQARGERSRLPGWPAGVPLVPWTSGSPRLETDGGEGKTVRVSVARSPLEALPSGGSRHARVPAVRIPRPSGLGQARPCSTCRHSGESQRIAKGPR